MPFDSLKNRMKASTIKLFVRRHFVADVCGELIPKWMNLVMAVLTTLFCQISWEELQQNKIIRVINKISTKKGLDTVAEFTVTKDT